MSDIHQRRKTRQGRPVHDPSRAPGAEEKQEPTTNAPDAGGSPAGAHHSYVEDEAESIRSGSQTAQDRDHTIRGGDDHTGPMKEFPT